MSANVNQYVGVTIIGAGLAGMVLALTLHSQNIPCKLYELRPESFTGGGVVGGAIMTSPNALRILDRLDIYSTLKTKGFNFETMRSATADYKTTDTYYFGHEGLYGYKAIRIYRWILLATLKNACLERGIPIAYGRKFSHVVNDTTEDITYEFSDGTQETSCVLIAADGIHSAVRRHIYPSITTAYQGLIAISTAVPKSTLSLPDSATEDPTFLPVTLSTPAGAFIAAPQNPDGQEIFVMRQVKVPDRGRKEWDALNADKDKLREMFRENYDLFPGLAQSAMDHAVNEKLTIWPFYRVPHMDRWTSETGRVILIGDAAHAIPPTTGNGANQAFEDSYTLGLLLGNALSGKQDAFELTKALPKWQAYRETRITGLLKLTLQLNNARLPVSEQAKLSKDEVWRGGGPEQMAWLYGRDPREELWAALGRDD